MKKLLACVAAVAMTFTISASSMAAPIEIKLGHVCPATGDRLEDSAQIFKKFVEEKSNGELIVKTFPASQLGEKCSKVSRWELWKQAPSQMLRSLIF